MKKIEIGNISSQTTRIERDGLGGNKLCKATYTYHDTKIIQGYETLYQNDPNPAKNDDCGTK